MESENQTRSEAAPVVLTHGPVVSYSPSPQLPSYLKDQNLKTTVLIEFVITALGSARPSLIGSSGNEELDALALTTARSWIFKPAFKDGKPIDGKVRLRINFDVQ